MLTAAALCGSPLPCMLELSGAASAVGCPDIEVVFARGTAEAPGVGGIGQNFVDALRWRTGGRAMDVYPVNYLAVHDFPPTVDGVADAGNHIRDTAGACPATRIVLGGFSRGAALAGYVTADTAAGPGFPPPLPPEVASHVAAVVLLGKSSEAYLASLDAPPVVIGSRYGAKTIDLCAPGDPVCSAGDDGAAHAAYAANGMTALAADFAAERLTPPETVPGPPL
jgi:hypothetical protein